MKLTDIHCFHAHMYGILRDVITRKKWNTVRIKVFGLGYVFLLSEDEYGRLKSYVNVDAPKANLSMQQNNIGTCAADNNIE